MLKIAGKSVSKGTALGPVVVWKQQVRNVEKKTADSQAETARLKRAQEQAEVQLQMLCHRAEREMGKASASIFEAHLMILQDEEYLGTIGHIIRTEKVNAEYAVWTVGERFSRMFADMDDDYMKARSADIRDISRRLVENLMDGESRRPDLTEPAVLVAEDGSSLHVLPCVHCPA